MVKIKFPASLGRFETSCGQLSPLSLQLSSCSMANLINSSHLHQKLPEKKLADVGLELSGDGEGGSHTSRHRWGDLRPVLSFPQHT